jgi:hypothetical protein
MWSTIEHMRIVRVDVGGLDTHPRPVARYRMATLLAAVLALVGTCATPALAAGSGSSKATINVEVPPKPIVSSVRPNAGPVSGGRSATGNDRTVSSLPLDAAVAGSA